MYNYIQNKLYCEKVLLEQIANTVNTPTFIYSKETISENINNYKKAFSKFNPLICYAVKANSNIAILKLISELGCGFDCVSEGEIRRVFKAGVTANNVIISGVGKTDEEIEFCIKNNILLINVESIEEIHRISSIAKKRNVKINIGIRINPNIDSGSHKKIRTGTNKDKFGIDLNNIKEVIAIQNTNSYINLIGISCHIGSQITSITPFEKTFKIMANLIEIFRAKKLNFKYIDIGGGVGINYKNEKLINLNDLVKLYEKYLAKYNLQLILEPGRSIIGNAGMLLTKVIEIKNSSLKIPFLIIDAGMNDIIRPALYNAYHKILPNNIKKIKSKKYNIVGPICESSDIHAKNYPLPIQNVGDLLIIADSGAYCSSMASNYNSRLFAAEVLVDNINFKIIRKRQTYANLFQNEVY
jgi:diaminopimelate decarboxylase